MKLIARLPTEKINRVADSFRSAIRGLQSRLLSPRRDNGIKSAPRTEFQQILEECLAKLSNGTATVEESLARYPQHADELRPLLRTVYFLNFKREEKPAYVYKASPRANIVRYLQSRLFQPQGLSVLWRTSAVFAALAITILVSGTTSAQSALPGDAFYGWKIASEEVWRTFSTDPLATELAISNRRISEMLAVVDDPVLSDSAMDGYLDSLDRLKSVEDSKTLSRIIPVLRSQHAALRGAGIVAAELDDHLVRDLRVLPASAVATQVPTDVPRPVGPTSQPNPTDPEPVGPNPTRPETDPTDEPVLTEPAPTELVPTVVPTEPVPTTVPTEPVPTALPTEPEPTTVPTEPAPTTVPTEPTEPTTNPSVPESTPVPPQSTPDDTDAPGNIPTLVETPVP